MTIVTARDRAMRLPGIAVLAGYRREWLRGDLLAGVAVAAYLVPQVVIAALTRRSGRIVGPRPADGSPSTPSRTNVPPRAGLGDHVHGVVARLPYQCEGGKGRSPDRH